MIVQDGVGAQAKLSVTSFFAKGSLRLAF